MNKCDGCKNHEVSSISSAALAIEGNTLRKFDSQKEVSETLRDVLDELTKNTISLPSTYNDKLTLDNLNKLNDLFKKEVDESFYEVFVII
jgi:hypothetical protein